MSSLLLILSASYVFVLYLWNVLITYLSFFLWAQKSIIAYLYFIVTYLYFQETLVKNPIFVAEELDFFADMQPVIQTNQQVMTPHDKFAPILEDNCEGDDQDGWNDVDDEAWSWLF